MGSGPCSGSAVHVVAPRLSAGAGVPAQGCPAAVRPAETFLWKLLLLSEESFLGPKGPLGRREDAVEWGAAGDLG